MPSHIRRGAGTTVGVGFVLNPRDCFVLAGAVRRLLLLLLLSVFIGAVGVSMDSIKLGEVLLAVGAVGTMSCGSTGCLSCRGKQSTSSSSSSGRSLLFLILLQVLSVLVDLSVKDSIKLGGVLLAAVGEISCGGTGCLSCRGKQSTSSSSSSGRSLLLFLILFSILS